jgi:hypothetical protein
MKVDRRHGAQDPSAQALGEVDVLPLVHRLEELLGRVEALDHVQLGLGFEREQAFAHRALELAVSCADKREELPLVHDAEVPSLAERVHARRDGMEIEQQSVLDQHPVAVP